MSSLAQINIKFSADLAEFSSQLQNASRQIEKSGKEMQKLGAGLTVGVTAPIIAFGVASVLAFDQSAQAIAQVEAALKSTGGAVGYNSEQLQKMASDLQSVTTFDDDEILKKATANLLTFSKITGTTFQDAQKAALDLATRLDGDLQSASIQVGKALNDPIKGVSALSKVGVSFSASQKEMIKSMVNTNDLAGAQAIILKELQTEFGGSAEAAAKAGTGSFKQLANQIGDLSEEFGKIIVEALLPFVGWVKDIVASIQALSPNIKIAIAVVAGLLAAIGPVLIILGTLATLLPVLATGFTLLTGPIGLVVAGLVAVAYVVANNWGVVKKTLVDVANYFVDLYNSSTVFRAGVEVIIVVFKNLWTNVKFVFNAIMSTAQFVVRNIFNYFSTLGKLIKSILTFDVSGVKEALKNGFGDAGKSAGTFFKDLQKNSKTASTEISKNISEAINNTLNGKKLAKFAIPKEKVETSGIASGVSDAVEEGVVAGAGKGAKKAGKVIKQTLLSLPKPEIASSDDVAPPSFNLGDYKSQLSVLESQRDAYSTTSAEYQSYAERINNTKIKIQAIEGGENLTAATDAVNELSDAQKRLIEIGQLVGQAVGDTFANLAEGLVASLGLAKTGFEGFVGGLLATITKLIAMMLASSISQAIAGSVASGTATGPAAIFTTPAFIATAVGGVLGAFAAIPKFETGGIIGGNSFYGDKILARVNSGELILNSQQQSRLHGLITPSSGGAVNVTLGGGFEIDGNKLRLVLDRTDKRQSRLG